MSLSNQRGMRLATKFLLALAAIAALTATVLLGYLGPRTTEGFVSRSDQIVTRLSALMRGLASDHARQSRDVVVELLDHWADTRARLLEDLPLTAYGNDVERVRRAIVEHDTERSERFRGNVKTLATEMERRSIERIDREVATVAAEQTSLSATFASDLRSWHLMLCGVLTFAMLGLLGFGLYRTIVMPVVALRAATQRIARGDLDVAVPVVSRDEVGELSMDFATMVAQLSESRDAWSRLNQDLENQVQKKSAQLVQAEKMASIGTLAGGIAHEFNNLIGGIRGCANEAMRAASESDRAEMLGMVVRTADRARSITQQLLRFARRSIENVGPTDVAGVLEEALRLIQPEARNRSVEVAKRFTGPEIVQGDADALHQVFVNLFTNALQAMPSGGILEVSLEPSATAVTIAVADTGVGIAAEDLGRVFEPFFTRKDQERDPAQRGTGLGLSVSYGIVAAHGGKMSVASVPGQGATFRVVLPRDPH